MAPSRHPGESRDPFRHHRGAARWIPAFAGMTKREPLAAARTRHAELLILCARIGFNP
jgi:hypothetical protein